MNDLSATAFQAVKPFPWLNPEGFLTDNGYHSLVETLPSPDMFDRRFGEARKHGQQPHDRLVLDYRPNLSLSAPWHQFVRELTSEPYRRFLARMLGREAFRLIFHWHYTPNGCSVSPHCDARRKLGSHIFYFNTDQNWLSEWGGQTLILDDAGRFPANSAPRFEDFDRIVSTNALGNRSLLIMRRERSWHGIKEICCPPNAFRKVFIVVFEDWSLRGRLKRLMRGSRREDY